MKKNCNNCKYLRWDDGDTGDQEGWVCYKKDLYGKDETKMLAKMERPEYREKGKRCFESAF